VAGCKRLRLSFSSIFCLKPDCRFLHASLQLALLRECTNLHEVKKTLETFPTDIKELYQRTWQRIIAQPSGKALIARNVLTWVVFATQSLGIDQLREAVATCPDTHEFEKDRLVPAATLIGLCHGLLAVEEGTHVVRLVRKSRLLRTVLLPRLSLTWSSRLHCPGHFRTSHRRNTSTTSCTFGRCLLISTWQEWL
jgi:hypothetical protein